MWHNQLQGRFKVTGKLESFMHFEKMLGNYEAPNPISIFGLYCTAFGSSNTYKKDLAQMHFLCFYGVFALTSDSLTTI